MSVCKYRAFIFLDQPPPWVSRTMTPMSLYLNLAPSRTISIIQVKNIQIWFCTYLNSQLLGAPSEYVLHGLGPGLDWAYCWFSFPTIFLVCFGSPSILLFVPTDQVSHSTPSLLTGRLLTSVQVNNMAALHDTYLHHINITIQPLP